MVPLLLLVAGLLMLYYHTDEDIVRMKVSWVCCLIGVDYNPSNTVCRVISILFVLLVFGLVFHR